MAASVSLASSMSWSSLALRSACSCASNLLATGNTVCATAWRWWALQCLLCWQRTVRGAAASLAGRRRYVPGAGLAPVCLGVCAEGCAAVCAGVCRCLGSSEDNGAAPVQRWPKRCAHAAPSFFLLPPFLPEPNTGVRYVEARGRNRPVAAACRAAR